MTPRTLRYLVAAVGIGLLFFACCGQADAQNPFWRPRPAAPPYSFTVEDEAGNSLPTFVKNDRTFVLAESGLRYNIRVRNPTAERVEAVLSVDGRDALSGEPGNYVSERGYVIPAYDSLLVEGFRRTLAEVAVFRFTSPDDSYSSRLGTPENVGVIGVAFFPEQKRVATPVIRRPVSRPAAPPSDYYGDASRGSGEPRDRAAAPPSDYYDAPREGQSDFRAPSVGARKDSVGELGSRSRVNNLGTQFAETRQSVVSNVPFQRALASHPALVMTLRYDDAPGLIARGIELPGYGYGRVFDDEPRAFPVSRFAQPPP